MRLFLIFVSSVLLAFLMHGFFYFVREYRTVSEKGIEVMLQANLLKLSIKEQERFIENENQKEKNLIFVGDIMLSRSVGVKIKKSGDNRFPFLKIADKLKSADLTFGNLEGPISDKGVNQGSIYSFRADPQVIEGLKFAGFDVLSLANNHIFDWGKDALVDTINRLKTENIFSVGVGENKTDANEPVIINLDGTKIAFFAYTNLYPKTLEAEENSSGISHFEIEAVKNIIRETKKSTDLVIISFHWGDEYKIKVNEEQKNIAYELVDAGADLIIGHHPHVIQEVEKVSSSSASSGQADKSAWIAYSLGNFVFDQNFSNETMEGLMLKVKIQGNKISGIQPIKIKINSNFQPFVE